MRIVYTECTPMFGLLKLKPSVNLQVRDTFPFTASTRTRGNHINELKWFTDKAGRKEMKMFVTYVLLVETKKKNKKIFFIH